MCNTGPTYSFTSSFNYHPLSLPLLSYCRWFCAALCPRQSASGCCSQPLPRFCLFSLSLSVLFSFCTVSSAAASALITMLRGKVTSREVVFLSHFLPPPPLPLLYCNPQLQTGPRVFIGWLQIGLFGYVFPWDFCMSLRHGASILSNNF